MQRVFALLLSGEDVPDLCLRPAWMDEAECLDAPDGVDFFARKEESNDDAKAVCRRCPVSSTCLAYAIEHAVVGVWGGTTTSERRPMRPDRRSRPQRLTDRRRPQRVTERRAAEAGASARADEDDEERRRSVSAALDFARQVARGA